MYIRAEEKGTVWLLSQTYSTQWWNPYQTSQSIIFDTQSFYKNNFSLYRFDFPFCAQSNFFLIFTSACSTLIDRYKVFNSSSSLLPINDLNFNQLNSTELFDGWSTSVIDFFFTLQWLGLEPARTLTFCTLSWLEMFRIDYFSRAFFTPQWFTSRLSEDIDVLITIFLQR